MIKLNRRIAYVSKPMRVDGPFEMSQGLLYMLIKQKMLKRLIQKIIIEVDKPTQIEYIILPNRWINRLYDNGFLRRGTL